MTVQKKVKIPQAKARPKAAINAGSSQTAIWHHYIITQHTAILTPNRSTTTWIQAVGSELHRITSPFYKGML